MPRRDDYKEVAFSIPFDNDTNDFDADNVQEAIEEVKEYGEGFPRSGVRGTYNGVVGNNDWLGPTQLHPNTPFCVFPVKLSIQELTWSNQRTDVEFRIQFRTVSKTGTIFYTLEVDSPNSGSGYVSGLNYEFPAGTVIYAQYLDDGYNCSDMSLTLWVSRVPD